MHVTYKMIMSLFVETLNVSLLIKSKMIITTAKMNKHLGKIHHSTFQRGKRIIKAFSVGLVLSTTNGGLTPRLSQNKIYDIGIGYFVAKHAVLRSKSKVSEWSDMSTRRTVALVSQYCKNQAKSVGLEYKADLCLIHARFVT